MQKFYFSGIASPKEAAILQQAGIRHALADDTDYPHIQGFPIRAQDSGAYKAFKAERQLTMRDWLHNFPGDPEADFIVMPDILGDPVATQHRAWELMTNRAWQGIDRQPWHNKITPVWQWGGKDSDLHKIIHEWGAPLVAIGGLVRPLRDKHQPTLTKLHKICDQYGPHLHLLGLNWLKAINELKDKCASADTSKWLDAARYGHLIFIHTKTGKIQQAPAKVLGHGDLTREQRLLQSAQAMDTYLNPPPSKPTPALCNGRTYVQVQTARANLLPPSKPTLTELYAQLEA